MILSLLLLIISVSIAISTPIVERQVDPNCFDSRSSFCCGGPPGSRFIPTRNYQTLVFRAGDCTAATSIADCDEDRSIWCCKMLNNLFLSGLNCENRVKSGAARAKGSGQAPPASQITTVDPGTGTAQDNTDPGQDSAASQVQSNDGSDMTGWIPAAGAAGAAGAATIMHIFSGNGDSIQGGGAGGGGN